ncbi:UDP-N-acetylmuramoyl-L-alanine--D-glutamate ligase [Kangiella koreensis]|uniref:UDP-N-acetylmuramoylalanine--D-glutamate ligase n=1 Tax=Kangiella koreensis (strain DSM 16069 / JCM 12317 / KCTC 12182 / SW-125) TaxID=523791 RepID=C7R9L6_KANKD|nr:UDP-N-acetylmuramoyl-L-alanine--D-glutamate ligase [Kangiella koreensis]ACV26107.1 UDP-N-acetylmuramoylalanine/D-glutamate ligase [Kangiella koreensis DSM 16069]
MQQKDIAYKNRLILGLGQTGLAVARYLSALRQPFNVMDTRDIAPGHEELEKLAPGSLLKWNGQQFTEYDELVVSPGIAIARDDIQAAQESGVSVIGDIELFAQANTLPVIAITGSNGKSTVTDLVGELINASGKKALVGGNIGVPALDLLKLEGDYVALELSSFQLESTRSLEPVAATVLNVSEDHLDRYKNYQEYIDAKRSIYAKARTCLVNADDENTWIKSAESGQNILRFGLSNNSDKIDWAVDFETCTIMHDGNEILKLDELTLQGIHNALNVAVALALVDIAEIELTQAVLDAAKSYQGLPHRSQLVAIKDGITFINDSKATNVGATVAAIHSFEPQFGKNIILIAGGDAKGADLSSLQEIIKETVKAVVCFGKDAPAIAKLAPAKTQLVSNLEEAVRIAYEQAQKGDLVLLSPACASLDMFANYMQRGEQFAHLVEAL